MSQICLPLGLDKADISKLEDIVSSTSVKHAGDILIRQGDKFDKIYAVKSGMAKSYRFDKAGTEYIQSFHLPGELFGLDAIYAQRYGFNVEALDTSVLCEMDFNELQTLCSTVPSLQKQLFSLLSRDIYNSHVNPIEHFDQTAEQKLSGFLHNLLSRLQARGHNSLDLHLPMSRRDIANHLGLAPETISRLLKRFQERGVITINNRLVTVQDRAKLEGLVHCHALETSIDISSIAHTA
ncbi:helix-turn-helix domain-containing protein [Arenicella xantha]|uniref:CRP/FNR family transcriptional regulator n=1 Tax=Arenicella xantha TaxID=644221 RepID=A0A395JM18_9GAMM|nr:helix-turn-helix domain-containing protein [Arenicella xantha]RBP50708.1 CRP/FNR family transcriptional regulator [Arenicella xantha]